jgi:hypothetical protein
MLMRLDEIEGDLVARRQRAEDEGWLGEIEGIDLTLSFLRGKRTHTQRFTSRVKRQPAAWNGESAILIMMRVSLTSANAVYRRRSQSTWPRLRPGFTGV